MSEISDTPREDVQHWKHWAELIGGLAGAFAAILLGLGVQSDTAQVVSFSTSVLLALGVALRWRAKRKNAQEREKEARFASWQNLQGRSAFRGLYAYSEGDVLPGEQRRRATQTISTQVLNPDFSFGIVAGEVGCGKTSLLQCGLSRYLREQNVQLCLIRSPRLLTSTNAASKKNTKYFTGMVEALQMQAKATPKGRMRVVIIDQFEEFLIESQDSADRVELGRVFQHLIASGLRIVCAVRHDYLLQMHDLSPGLPDPISTPNLFPIRNFDVTEAAQVIQECATLDRIAIPPALAIRIATDLAQGGHVRPPELQVVCSALAGDLTFERYNELGGARGIISDYIKTAVTVCPDIIVAKLLLRELCDFEASPPAKAAPRTAEELSGALTASTGSHPGINTLEQILQTLQKARIIVSSRLPDSGQFQYSLVHDYLVTPVSLATSEISTRTEDANRLLSLYVSAFETDPKTRIPLRKLRTIRANASPDRLRSPLGRKLLKLSQIGAVQNVTLLVIALGISFALLSTASGLRIDYKPQVVARLLPDISDFTEDQVSIVPIHNGEFILTQANTSAILWHGGSLDSTTVISLNRRMREMDENYIVKGKTSGTVTILNLNRGNITTIIPTEPGEEIIAFANSLVILKREHNFSVLTTNVDSAPELDGSPYSEKPVDLRAWSLKEGREVGRLNSVSLLDVLSIGHQGRTVLLRLNRRFVLWTPSEHGKAEDLVAIEGVEQEIGLYIGRGRFEIDESAGVIGGCTGRYGYLWNLNTGALVRKLPTDDYRWGSNPYSYPDRYPYDDSQSLTCGISVSSHGAAFFVENAEIPSMIAFVPMDTMRAPSILATRDQISVMDNRRVVLRGSSGTPTYILSSPRSGHASIWNPRSNTILPMPNFTLRYARKLRMNRDGMHLLLQRGRRNVQIWNLMTRTLSFEYDSSVRILNAEFTLDGTGIMLVLEGGGLAFHTINGEKITHINDAGGSAHQTYLNPECGSINIWTDEGKVLQYQKGLSIPRVRFFPLQVCEQQKDLDGRT